MGVDRRDDRRHERLDRARGGPNAVAHARAGGGPVFVEALTYRFVGHSRSDPGTYRPDGELDRWRERDPIVVLRARSRRRESTRPSSTRSRRVTERAGAHARGRPRRAVPDRADRPRVQGLSAVPPRELTMPKLSDSMEDAVILRWLKAAGEDFARGEGSVEVETDKATVVYEAEWDGTLDAILVPEGATVAVGEPIATLANGDGAARRRRTARTAEPEPAAAPRASLPPGHGAADDSGPGRPVATPVARRTAVELGVSLHGLTGTGPGGRIIVDDVTRAAAEADAAPAERAHEPVTGKGEVSVLEPTPTQATIARRMTESATTIPVFTVSADVDVSQIVASRREARERGRGRAVRERLRGQGRGRQRCASSRASTPPTSTARSSSTHASMSASRSPPTTRCSCPWCATPTASRSPSWPSETRTLADGARRRTLLPEDFHDGTFTVSNLGMFGVGRSPRSSTRRRSRSSPSAAPPRAGRGRCRPHRVPRSHDRHAELRPPCRLRRRRRTLPVPATRAARAAARSRPLTR